MTSPNLSPVVVQRSSLDIRTCVVCRHALPRYLFAANVFGERSFECRDCAALSLEAARLSRQLERARGDPLQ